jgi:ubiquinone/menaquinone biosynthesis C-methylase UbiE
MDAKKGGRRSRVLTMEPGGQESEKNQNKFAAVSDVSKPDSATPRESFSAPGCVAEDPWEAAYLRFETPEQEIRKFTERLRKLGAARWPHDAEIVELFCGRGNGLHALGRLGFRRLEGVDLSAHLLAQYRGDAKCTVADCRKLPFADGSKDVLIVQGGLHHLPAFPGDLDKTLQEMRRVLRKNGRLVLVEPWRTPFLIVAHLACGNGAARRLSKKVDALATMIQYERRTYEQWLSQPDTILKLVRNYFVTKEQRISWGKWSFVGAPL